MKETWVSTVKCIYLLKVPMKLHIRILENRNLGSMKGNNTGIVQGTIDEQFTLKKIS